MPRLVLLRHAKSEWPAGTQDHERPLSERGIGDARAAARWLNEQDWQISKAIVSSSRRTQETFEILAEDLRYSLEKVDEPRIYEAATSEILDVLQSQHDETVLIVGHGPGVPRLAVALSHGEIPRELELRGNYPTCAISVLESDAPWSDWQPGVARFVNFVVPRGKADTADDD